MVECHGTECSVYLDSHAHPTVLHDMTYAFKKYQVFNRLVFHALSSVPDKRGVSGQKPDKVTYMTRQTDRKISNDLVEIVGIDPLEFGIDAQA